MSPTSDPTVLLWGNNWWLPGKAEPVAFSGMAEAARTLAEEWHGRSRHLRLIFQPDSLSSVPVTCPLGNRGTLRDALCFEHPQIQDEAIAWGFEPVLAAGDGHASILHYEEKAALFDLVSALAQQGFRVSSAWPLATYLAALPEEWSEPGGFAVAAVSETRSLAYQHPSTGSRAMQTIEGEESAAQVLQTLAEQKRTNAGDSILVVAAGALSRAIPEGYEVVSVADVLSADVLMPRSHPAQLLPPEAMLSAQRAVMAASFFLLLTGAASAFQYATAYQTANRQARDAVIEKAQLEAEIQHLRVNQAEIIALKAKLHRPADSPIVDWLDRVCAGLPRSVALSRLLVDQGRFRIEGHLAPDATNALDGWLRGWSGPRWRTEPPSVRTETGAFTLNGSFLP
jgi:hypothetical protein